MARVIDTAPNRETGERGGRATTARWTLRVHPVLSVARTHTHTPSGGEEGDRYDSVVSDSTRRTDERRSRLDLSNLWKSRRLRVRRNYPSFGGEREEEKKKKKDEG